MSADARDDVGNGFSRPWHRFYAPGVPTTIGPPAFASIGAMVTGTAQRHDARPAFSNLGATLSFRDVDRQSDQFAAFLLHDLGLAKGDRIAIQMPNLLQQPVILFGALKAGLVVVNVNPLYTAAEMRTVFADARPKALVVLANFADKVEQVLPSSAIEHVIVTEVADLLPQPKRALVNFVVSRVKKLVPRYDLPQAVSLRSALARGRRHRLSAPDVDLDDVAVLQYTGGTTGGVKAAVLTHRNLLSNQDQILRIVGTRLDEGRSTVIAALPLYHVFSLTVNGLGLFGYGAHNVLITDPTDVPALAKTIGQARPDGIILVNTLAAGLIDDAGFAGLDFGNLKVAIAGGMAVHTSVAERWREVTGQHLTEGYGLTEASPVVSVNPIDRPPRQGSIGVPLPSTDVRIVDDGGAPVPAGEPGELLVHGPQVMREYWNRPEETADTLTSDGWLRTGDIARIDEDGFLWIVDRKKETIVVSGFNVYPNEIEDAATQHPKVREAGAIRVPDERTGETPKLFVVKRDDSLTEEELRAHLKLLLTGYKRPRYIEFRDELPKTNVGKVLRRALAEEDGA